MSAEAAVNARNSRIAISKNGSERDGLGHSIGTRQIARPRAWPWLHQMRREPLVRWNPTGAPRSGWRAGSPVRPQEIDPTAARGSAKFREMTVRCSVQRNISKAALDVPILIR
jgi:hypothetical protein